MNKLIYNITLVLFLSTLSCKNESAERKHTTTKEISKNIKSYPDFNEDSAYSFINTQVSFGSRVISSPGWEKCGLWLEKKLLQYTDDVTLQTAPITTYDGKTHTLKNIIASFSPKKNNRIALFAHWDSRHIADQDTKNKNSPKLGANDGGSGVGVLIELARSFKNNPPRIGVDIIFFDAEDYGDAENTTNNNSNISWCLGSQHWSNNIHKPNYSPKYGILLDMVAGENAKFYREGYSMENASFIVEKVWKRANKLNFGNYFIYQNSPKILDDHVFVNYIAKIPTINIIEHDPSTSHQFNKHWHTHKDDMKNIDKKTLNADGTTLVDIIYNE